jgi:hypothetical protein
MSQVVTGSFKFPDGRGGQYLNPRRKDTSAKWGQHIRHIEIILHIVHIVHIILHILHIGHIKQLECICSKLHIGHIV